MGSFGINKHAHADAAFFSFLLTLTAISVSSFICGRDEELIMTRFYFAIIGVIIMAVGVMLVRKYRAPANRSCIGSFTLLPLAGFAYLIGILCIISGSVFILLGLIML